MSLTCNVHVPIVLFSYIKGNMYNIWQLIQLSQCVVYIHCSYDGRISLWLCVELCPEGPRLAGQSTASDQERGGRG